MTAPALAGRIALSEVFFLRGGCNGGFEWKAIDFQTAAEALAYYDENVASLTNPEVGTVPVEKLAQDDHLCDLDGAGRRVSEYWSELKQTIHHRGQLSSYLLPVGVEAPPISRGKRPPATSSDGWPCCGRSLPYGRGSD
jgi:hypothetical protein